MLENLKHLLDAGSWLHAFGPWALLGIAIIIFIESGVLFPFLPGDSLLVTAAILAPSLGLSRWWIGAVAIVAAFLGDQAGYWLGRGFGTRLFRPGARVLTPERLGSTHEFFTKYGAPALVLGRFVPIVRTYVPLTAGIAGMRYRRFLLWNGLGAVGWVVLLVLVGTLLGNVPGVAHNIDIIMIIVVLISVLPVVISALMRRRTAARAATAVARQDAVGQGADRS